MKFGIERLLEDASLRAPLRGRRVALVAHPASVTRDLTHSLDALAACEDIRISAAFGPQHGGLRGVDLLRGKRAAGGSEGGKREKGHEGHRCGTARPPRGVLRDATKICEACRHGVRVR